MVLALAVTCAEGAGPETVLSVVQFGARGDGSTDDGAAIRAAFAAARQRPGPVRVDFPPGTYRLGATSDAPGDYCVSISGATDLTLSGSPGRTTLLCTGQRAGVLRFTACTNVTVSGVVIDYETPPFSQGTITAVVTNGPALAWRSDAGYPPPDPARMSHRWGVVLDREAAALKPGTASHVPLAGMQPTVDGQWLLTLRRAADLAGIGPGDAFVMRNGGEGHAVCLVNVHRARVRDVTVHAAASLAVAIVGGDGELVVERLTVGRRAGTDRLVSANADGVHCQRVRGRIWVEGCRFEGMTDDGMNTYDPARFVTAIRSSTEWEVNRTFDTRVGDRVQVMDPHTGRVRGEAQVLEVSGRWLRVDTPVPGLRTSTRVLHGITSMTNHLDADVVFNLGTCGAGYVIRSNHFGPFRGRGVVLRGVQGLIEGNTFERTSGPGVVIANEPAWPEGPVPRDVTIRGNRFIGVGTDAHAAGYGAIHVTGLGLDGVSPSPDLSGLVIEENVILDPPGSGIFVAGCGEVRLFRNQVEVQASRAWPQGRAIRVRSSTDVRVDGLEIVGGLADRTEAVDVDPASRRVAVTNVVVRGVSEP